MDKFESYMTGLNTPADTAYDVSPNNSVDLENATRGFICTTAGTVKVDMVRGGTVTFTVLAGVLYPFRVKRIYATGTSATGIVALY